MNEFLTFLPIIILAVVLLKLSGLEIGKSLEKSKRIEESLKRERDMFKISADNKAKELEESRFARMNELRKAAEFGKLSQGLFHDLMTPLSSIVLHTEKLGQISQKEIGEAKSSVKKAVEASKIMSEYLENIKSTIKSEEIKKHCYIKREIREVLSLLGYKIRQTNTIVSLDMNEGYWYGDPIKLKQIILNLVSNSLDSFEEIEKEKREIIIKGRKSKGMVNISVSDNGSGINEENLNRIFEPFFSTKSKDKGIGIGLATVKSIVEKDMKGKINFNSRYGFGTTFTVEIPIS